MKVSIVIQAGGQSSRMGVDKGLVELCGKPMIQNIIERLEPYSNEMLITTNNPETYQHFGFKTFEDIYKYFGALAGLHTALNYAQFNSVFVIACDLPFVNISLFKYMKNLFEAKPADIVIPRTEKGYEPFYTFYNRETCLPLVRSAIISGKRKMISWHENALVHPVYEDQLREFDPNLRSFMNVNTPEELELAQLGCLDI